MPRGSPRLRTHDGRKNQLGKRLKQRRIELGYTQDTLNAKLALATNGEWIPSLQEILHIESGGRTVTDLEILALGTALSCSPEWLLTGNQPKI